MNLQKILSESTIYQTSSHGIKFGTRTPCGHCGKQVHTWDTPWMRFDGISVEECRAEAVWQYGMIQVKAEKENNGYYSEENDSEECCDLCND